MTGSKKLSGGSLLVLFAMSIGLTAVRFCPAATPDSSPTTGPVTAWSQPVNGITVRIEQGVPLLHNGYEWRGKIYLRVKNVSDHSINMPLAAESGTSAYTVWISVDDRWEKAVADETGLEAPPEFCVLDPGDDLLCPVSLPGSKRLRLAEAEKIVIDSPKTGNPADWSGRIESAAITDYTDEAAIAKIAGTLAMPHHPSIVLASKPELNTNAPANAPPFDGWWTANFDASAQFRLYPDRDVAAFFDRQRNSTGDYQLQMVYAAVASARGSNDAVEAIANRDRLDSGDSVQARVRAIDVVLSGTGSDRLVDAALDMMHDDRTVRELPQDPPQRIRDIIHTEVICALGGSKLESARSAILKLAESGDLTQELIWAVGRNPDPKAEAVLLRIAHGDLRGGRDPADDEFPKAALMNLANRHCRAASTLLIDRLPDRDAVEALGELGDPAAVPALRRIAAGDWAGVQNSDRAEAELSLIKLEPADRVAKLGRVLADPAMGGVRLEAGRMLAESTDPAAVPALLKIARDDPDGSVAENAIRAMAQIRSAAAITGLIDALERAKPRRGGFKMPYTAEQLDDTITAGLRSATGQSFGPSRARWQKWWHDHGQADPRFR